MHTVGRVQADTLAVWLLGVLDQFVDVCGTEILAGTAEFLDAPLVADVGILDDQMRRLIFFVFGAGVVEVGELVDHELAVALGRPEQMGFGAAVGG